ncbi:MAG: arylsulfatase, partial [Chthoniobacteraceae bacterium]
MKRLLRLLLPGLLCLAGFLHAAPPPNVLIITVDDMSADSLGAFGCKLPGTSPQIDRLAAQGMRFH